MFVLYISVSLQNLFQQEKHDNKNSKDNFSLDGGTTMKVGIAGARGSIPTPTGNTLFDRSVATARYGGNTTCVYVQSDDGSEHILDAGTGIRDLGIHLAKEGGFNGQSGRKLNLYISHTHWDHIQGLPFFVPAYIGGNRITVFGEAKVRGVHPDTRESLERAVQEHSDRPGLPGILTVEGDGLRTVLGKQQDFRNFPAPLQALQGITAYLDFVPGTRVYDSPTMNIDTLALNHPGNSISYRFTEKKADGTTKTFVFTTDWEPKRDDGKKVVYDKALIEFWAGADLVLSDSQYEPLGGEHSALNPFMVGWGHSDFQTNLWYASEAGVKEIGLTHLEPKSSDVYYDALEQRAQLYSREQADRLKRDAVKVEIAKEGTWKML